MKTIGQIGYEAYCASTGWKSLVSGQPLPQWEKVAERIQSAWEAAGTAITQHVENPVQAGQATLVDTDLMPFGKYKGKRMQDVPAHYLHYLWQDGLKGQDAPVANYIRNNLATLSKEHPDGIWS